MRLEALMLTALIATAVATAKPEPAAEHPQIPTAPSPASAPVPAETTDPLPEFVPSERIEADRSVDFPVDI